MLDTMHPAVEHAEAAVRSLRKNGTYALTDDQARNVIVVEMTPREFFKLATQTRVIDQTVEGALRINGIRYYVVDQLKDGDTWRVLNALGVN